MKKPEYRTVQGYVGIKQHLRTKKFQATVKVKNKRLKRSFRTLRQAVAWRKEFDQSITLPNGEMDSSTLKTVWDTMQAVHFPTLARSTQQIWIRRYHLLKDLEDLRMHKITPSVITSWVERHVGYYKSDEYVDLCRGNAKRCNLNNELNLLTTIFNWYKTHESFEKEAIPLSNPVRTKHKKASFIRVKPIKKRAIELEDALKFFMYLKPLYRDLAMIQFFTASRIGEVSGLQWNRIDLERREMTIMETCNWDMSSKMYIGLNPHPKNKEPRPVYLTDELVEILHRRNAQRKAGCNFVFHVEGEPLNYCTIQVNYRGAQRKAQLPYTGTHILRHGMATLARKVGGGLDAVIAMTGHKDIKLADHYSKLTNEVQKETSLKVMDHIKNFKLNQTESFEGESNVISLRDYSNLA